MISLISPEELIKNIENCFSEVSDQFLDKVSKEIAEKTHTQTVIIHRLLTFKEYIDLKFNEGCPHVQLIDDDIDDDDDSDDKSIVDDEIQYLFVKACYSSIKHPTNDKIQDLFEGHKQVLESNTLMLAALDNVKERIVANFQQGEQIAQTMGRTQTRNLLLQSITLVQPIVHYFIRN